VEFQQIARGTGVWLGQLSAKMALALLPLAYSVFCVWSSFDSSLVLQKLEKISRFLLLL
jgi:hypothetical protein